MDAAWSASGHSVPGAGSGSLGRARLARCVAALLAAACTAAVGARADLPVETLGRSETLPVPYPRHWFWATDSAFDHYLDGRIILLNADDASPARQRKGMVNASFMAQFVESERRGELYVAESYFERGHRGARRDSITVYDKPTLSPLADIDLPAGKRANMFPGRFQFRLIGADQFLLVYNFTPATSVTVVDVAARRVVNEIPLPGCALMYPTGALGFSSLCADASMVTFRLDGKGQVAATAAIKPFFDIQKDPLFENPAIVAGVAYFPTFDGDIQEIDLRGDSARLAQKWSLLDAEAERGGWRPGGMDPIAADAAGRIYVLMHPHGKEGSHKDDGREVWVFDAARRSRVRRIVLKDPGFTLELTRDPEPLLLVVNRGMNIDVYDAAGGAYLRTLRDFGQETPLLLQAVR